MIAKLLQFAKAVIASRGVRLGVGAAGIADVLNIDLLRRESVRLAPRSDPEALEQASRNIITFLGLDGTEVIGPKDVSDWNYLHIDAVKGRMWWTKRYYSAKSVAGARRAARRIPSKVIPSYSGGRR